MRMVSWIVVVGAMAWLVYGQLRIHFSEEALAAIPDEKVSGTVKSERHPSAAAGEECLDLAKADAAESAVTTPADLDNDPVEARADGRPVEEGSGRVAAPRAPVPC